MLKPDNLDRDSAEAMRLGYGVHYGRYKADHPHTRDRAEPESDSPGTVRCCPQCGKRFTVGSGQNRRVYCCDECRKAFQSAAYARRYRERKAAMQKEDTGK